MPVLEIVTENKDKNALDFVTKPVAEHVAKSKATWDPGFSAPAPYYEQCSVSLTGTDGSTLIDSASAQVKVRGNWTTAYDKKPLRIKFDEKQSVLSLNNGNEMKNWVLLAEYKDGSMLRNKSALAMADEILSGDIGTGHILLINFKAIEEKLQIVFAFAFIPFGEHIDRRKQNQLIRTDRFVKEAVGCFYR